MTIHYKTTANDVDWEAMRNILLKDDFHNGRSPEQYRTSFENSFAICIAYDDAQIIGTVRALSDGVCNAYIVDVWTYSKYRRQGIARHMIDLVLEKLPGQHVYLWTDDQTAFYQAIGFKKTDNDGLEKVVGSWLINQ
mgnify:CR=1 FL=1